MTPSEQMELDVLKQQLRETENLLKQEKGKVVAMERDSYETKRNAKQMLEQAEALKGETDAALQQSAQDMKVALCVSQGIFGLARLCRNYIAKQVTSGRIVHREQQLCLVMKQAYEADDKSDQIGRKAAFDRMKTLVKAIEGDGERARANSAMAALNYGFNEFEKVFDQLTTTDNEIVPQAKTDQAI